MGKPLILGVNWLYHWIRRPNVSYSMCNFYGATTTANWWFLRKTGFYNGKFYILGACKVRVENFCTKLPKGTPLRQIWSNKSFGVCGSDVVLTLESDDKKVRENRHWKLDVVYNTTSLPRRRENVTLAEKLNANMQIPSVRSLITIFVTETMMNMTWIKTWLIANFCCRQIDRNCVVPYVFFSMHIYFFWKKKRQPGRKPGRQPGRMPFSQVIWPGAPWPRAATGSIANKSRTLLR